MEEFFINCVKVFAANIWSIILGILFIFLLALSALLLYKHIELKKKLNEYIPQRIDENKGFYGRIIAPFGEIFFKFNYVFYFILSLFFYFLSGKDFSVVNFFGITFGKDQISTILVTIGTVMLSSGVFNSITKSSHFLEIFSDQIKRIFYTEEYIAKQKNLDEIFNNVTKAICKENFNKINDKLHQSILNNYLPANQNFYYQDCEIEINMKESEIGMDYVEITEKTSVNIICEGKGEIEIPLNSIIQYDQNDQESTNYQLLAFDIDNVSILGIFDPEIKYEDGAMKIVATHKLSKQESYKIFREEKKTYSIKLNPNRVHTMAKIYNNFKLTVFYPNTFDLRFVKLGFEEWGNVEKYNISEDMKILKTKHDGIFLKNQGYMINFYKP